MPPQQITKRQAPVAAAIIYPVLGLGLILGIDGWNTFGRKPITERDIRREMDRLGETH